MNKVSGLVEEFIQSKIDEFVKENPIITYKELANKLGVSERSIYRYAKKYDLPIGVEARRIGKCAKYLKDKGYTIVKN